MSSPGTTAGAAAVVAPITAEQMIERMKTGDMAMVVEYRSSKADRGTMRVKETGVTREFVTLTHNCELPTGFVAIRERVEDNFRPETYVSPFRKGQICAAFITYYGKNQKGAMTCSGSLVPLASK